MFYDSWPCDQMKSKTHNHGFLLNSRWLSWWACIMNYWVGSGSLDCWFIMVACMTHVGSRISALELKDDKYGLEGWTNDERSKSSMSRNSHGVLPMMNDTCKKINGLKRMWYWSLHPYITHIYTNKWVEL